MYLEITARGGLDLYLVILPLVEQRLREGNCISAILSQEFCAGLPWVSSLSLKEGEMGCPSDYHIWGQPIGNAYVPLRMGHLTGRAETVFFGLNHKIGQMIPEE